MEQLNIDDAYSMTMNESESLAYEILKILGWNPRKIIINTRTGENIGMPDFKCNKNRYVEVKKGKDGFQLSQTNVIYDLIEDGKEIYIMVFTEDLSAITMYRYLYKLIPLTDCPLPDFE